MTADDIERFVAYGLCFESQLSFGRWLGRGHEHLARLARGRPTDVHIRLGRVDDSFDAPRTCVHELWWKLAPGRLVFEIEGVARYGISHGTEIVIDPARDAPADWLGVFACGSAFGALFHQRHLLPLHASVVGFGQRAMLFLGHAGAGKSTLAAALCRNGCSFLADDIAVISGIAEGRPRLNPGAPQLKLTDRSARWLGEDPAALRKHTAEDDKYLLAQPIADELPVGTLYLLESSDTSDQPRLEPLSGAAKLARLIEHTYRYFLVDGLGTTRYHFKQCVELATRVEMLRLIRPTGLDRMDDTIGLLSSSWAS